MGKIKATRHQKFLKSEKAKVKLKAKKELPKGTNDTKTNFKVKKIIIKEHAKPAAGEVVIKNKLGLKELLSRLRHFNTNSRVDALIGIKELVKVHSDQTIFLNVGVLLHGVCPLVLDKERSVRREAYHTLHCILEPQTSVKILPFFDILCSYLRCAMTHIDTNIHEDSLFYFDVLLSCVPNLVVVNYHKIFPSFLDMISKLKIDSKPGRTLTMNLGSKMTSVKWRTKVLLRLLQFLRTLINLKLNIKDVNSVQNYITYSLKMSSKEILKGCTFHYDKSKCDYFSLYKGIKISKISCFSKDKNIMAKCNESDNDKLQQYVEVLMPLLFDTWLEVRPGASNEKKVESIVSDEGFLILQNILEIIILLWQMLKIMDEELHNNDLSKWFVDKFGKPFSNFISDSFPYSQSSTSGKKNVTIENNGLCLQENLRICYIYLIFNTNFKNKPQETEVDKILEYVRYVLDYVSHNSQCQMEIIAILSTALASDNLVCRPNMELFINKLISIAMLKTNLNPEFEHNIFECLCSILLNEKLKNLQSLISFQTWLKFLPNMLWENVNITSKSFDIIVRFAIQNNALFNSSVKEKLHSIVTNLPKIKIIDMPNRLEADKKVINLLYWVNCWDTESLNVLQDQLADNKYSNKSREYLVDILKLKTEGLYPM